MTRSVGVAILVVVGAMGVVASGCGKKPPTAPTIDEVPQPGGTITEPPNGRTIESASVTASGTYGPAGSTASLWLLVWPDLAPGVGFPQSASASAGEPASKNPAATPPTWTTVATFGGPPQGYELVLYSATPEASNVLANAVRTGTGGLARVPTPGLITLPSGLTQLHSVRVTRGPLALIVDPVAGFVSPTPDLTVRGTYAAGLNDSIWVLVFPEQANGLGYPQSPNAAAGLPSTKDPTRSTWSVPITLGGPAQAYDVRVYYADASASSFLTSTLIRWVVQNTFPGLSPSELPQGLHEQQKITIRKR